MSEKDLSGFTDEEIRSEYEERFGAAEDVELSEFDSVDLIEELEDRGEMPDPEPLQPEIVDLIAEAARTSRHARMAYDLLRSEEAYGVHTDIVARQRMIAGRMKEVVS